MVDIKTSVPLSLLEILYSVETIKEATGNPVKVTNNATQKNIFEKSLATSSPAKVVTIRIVKTYNLLENRQQVTVIAYLSFRSRLL